MTSSAGLTVSSQEKFTIVVVVVVVLSLPPGERKTESNMLKGSLRDQLSRDLGESIGRAENVHGWRRRTFITIPSEVTFV